MNIYKKTLFKNIVPYLPLVVIYIVLILVLSPDNLAGDEPRHIRYAANLTKGYFTTAENPSLRIGPGYPMFITLPVLLDTPYIIIRLLNIPLLLLALFFFHKTLSIYVKPSIVKPLIYLLGLYPPVLRNLIEILSESLALFLVCGFLYYFIQLYRNKSRQKKYLLLAALFLGLLALTKVMFGYVILCGLFCCLIIYLFRKSKKAKLGLLVLIGSFLCCIPYLGYTYSLTGKPFLWGTQGGEMLYWRSTPFENEYGNWISSDVVLGKLESKHFDATALSKNHGDFIKMLAPYSEVQKDSLFKEKAIENIKSYPLKYIKNTVASASRIFYNFPFSYTTFKPSTYAYIIPNTFLVVFLILAFYLGVKKFKAIPFEIRLLALIGISFVGGLTLLDGKIRHLLPIVPILLFLIVYVFNRFLQIKIIKPKLNTKPGVTE